MIYYQYSQHFNQLSQAILWAEKQKPRLEQLKSKMFIRFQLETLNTTFTVYRSQCQHDLEVADMIMNEGIEQRVTYAEYMARETNHGQRRREDGLVVPHHKLVQWVYV